MPTHNVHFESDTSIVAEIVRAVSATLDTALDELPPLEDSVDTEMLQRLVDSRSNGSVQCGRVAFQYADLTVSVDVNGEVDVEPGRAGR